MRAIKKLWHTFKKWWYTLSVLSRLLFLGVIFILFLMFWRALSDGPLPVNALSNLIDMMLGASGNNGNQKWHSLMALGYVLSGIIVVLGLWILNRRTTAQMQAAKAQAQAAQSQEHTVQTQLATIKSGIFDKAIDKLSSKKNIHQQAGLFMLRDIAYKTNDKYREDTKSRIREPQDYTSIIMNVVIKILNSFKNLPIMMGGTTYDKSSMSKSMPIFLVEDASEIKQLIINLFFKPSIDPKSIMQMYRENKKAGDKNKKIIIKADLSGIDMSGAYLENINMEGSNLKGCQFKRNYS